MQGWVIRIAIIAVIVVGGLVFRDRLSGNAGELKVGDCFDDPNATGVVTDVQHHPCNESHTAEVFFLGKLPDGDFPTSATVQGWVLQNCVPAWNAYTGRSFDAEQVLTIGLFRPSQDGWSKGDRDILCYTVRADGAPMTTSARAAAR